MLMFEHTGPHHHREQSVVRDVLMGAVLAVGAVVLFPFTLLGVFLWALGAPGQPRDRQRVTGSGYTSG